MAAKAGADYIESIDQIGNTFPQMNRKEVAEEGKYLEVGVVEVTVTGGAEDGGAEALDYVIEKHYTVVAVVAMKIHTLNVDNLCLDYNSAAVEGMNPNPERIDFLALVAAAGG